MTTLLLTTLAVTLVGVTTLWLLSLLLHDASIVDVFWGIGFAVIALVACATGDGAPPRKMLVATLATIWGFRLGLYLLWRNWGEGEDPRYQAMRRHHGARFWWRSLIVVFGLQGALMWLISLPLQVAQQISPPHGLTWLDGLGATLWLVGITFESVGDLQLARFKADPANRGAVMDRGLWRYTRHPNYFGDAVLWWGFFTIALAVPGGAWTIVSPIVMTYLLTNLSGVPLLEKRMAKTRPRYAEYVQRTSAFVPWPPRAG